MSRKRVTPAFNLIDTGPLVALLDENDPAHKLVADCLDRLPNRPLLTTWPCLTEAMYFLHCSGGHAAQEELWNWLADGTLHIYDLDGTAQQRMRSLMAKYADTPVDLADASLVVVAESLELRRVFTLDDDFYIYRLANGSTLEIVR